MLNIIIYHCQLMILFLNADRKSLPPIKEGKNLVICCLLIVRPLNPGQTCSNFLFKNSILYYYINFLQLIFYLPLPVPVIQVSIILLLPDNIKLLFLSTALSPVIIHCLFLLDNNILPFGNLISLLNKF